MIDHTPYGDNVHPCHHNQHLASLETLSRDQSDSSSELAAELFTLTSINSPSSLPTKVEPRVCCLFQSDAKREGSLAWCTALSSLILMKRGKRKLKPLPPEIKFFAAADTGLRVMLDSSVSRVSLRVLAQLTQHPVFPKPLGAGNRRLGDNLPDASAWLKPYSRNADYRRYHTPI